MKKFTVVLARSNNGVIGVNGKLPWNSAEDMAHFKALTVGSTVVMGRKTWESLPKPLVDRHNIVVTRNQDYVAEGADVATSLGGAFSMARTQEVFVIGGSEIYALALLYPYVTKVVETIVQLDVDGDAYAPKICPLTWICVEQVVNNECSPPIVIRTHIKKHRLLSR